MFEQSGGVEGGAAPPHLRAIENLSDMIRAHVKQAVGVGGDVTPLICRPLRTVAIIDEDSRREMIQLHIYKERRGCGAPSTPFANH